MPWAGLMARKVYKIFAPCERCGNCCRYLSIMAIGVPIGFWLGENLSPPYLGITGKERLAKIKTLVRDDSTFTCVHFQEPNICKVYNERPDICRNFPEHSEVGTYKTCLAKRRAVKWWNTHHCGVVQPWDYYEGGLLDKGLPIEEVYL